MIQLLFGDNTYSISRATGRIVAEFTEAHGEGSVDTYQAEAISPQDLPQLLQGQSLFSDAKLIVLNTPSTQKALWDGLGEYLEHAGEVDLLITDPKPDKRTKTFKWLQKHADVRECKSLDERETITWLETEARRLGVNCTHEMARFLVRHSGTDQWRLSNDLAKLSLTGKPLSHDLILDVIEPHPEATAFELLDAITAGKHAEAQRLLSIIRDHEEPYRFLGLVISQLYALAVCVESEGRPSQQIAKDTGIHPYVAQKTMVIARSTSREKVLHMISIIEECDLSLKTTGADPWTSISASIGRM
ncbi:MAG: DNA polymerase III subunit delta [Candidatus Saccharimonadales bacterium]